MSAAAKKNLTSYPYDEKLWTHVYIQNATSRHIAAAACDFPSPYIDSEAAISYAHKWWISSAPDELIHAKDRLINEHSLITSIHNLPVSINTSCPPNNRETPTSKNDFVSEFCALGISSLIGQPYSYSSEKNGDLIHNIMPSITDTGLISNEGSKHDLLMHTEIAHLFPLSPYFLCIFCLRHDIDHKAETFFVISNDIIKNLTPQELNLARESVFNISCPDSFTNEKRQVKTVPLLRHYDNGLEALVIQLNTLSGTTPSSRKLLEKLNVLCSASSPIVNRTKLVSGDMILLNNIHIAHGRSSFSPPTGFNDRWLQRVYITKSLRQFDNFSTEKKRVFDIC
jgi:L-asparagine oxygenase